MRRSIALIGLVVVLVTGVAEADRLVDVYVNGEKQDFKPRARVREGKSYAPLRAACEAVGADVKWLEAQQAASVCKGLRCTLIRKHEGIIVKGRLLIPLRLMAEALEAQVTWDAQRKAVLIKTEASESEAQAPAPGILLRKMLAAYQGATTYQSEGRDTVWTTMPGMKMEMDSPTKVIYQAPNLLCLDSGLGMYQQRYVSDGEHLYRESGMMNQVFKAPAPESLEELVQGVRLPMMAEAYDTEVSSALRFDQLIGGAFDLKRVKSVRPGCDRNNEWLASLAESPNTWALTLTMEEGPPAVLWIDRDSHVLCQTAIELTGEDMMPGGEEEVGTLAQYFQDMTMRVLMVRGKTAIDEPVAEEVFAYQPPAGYQVVEGSESSSVGPFGSRGTPEPEASELVGGEPFDFTAPDIAGNEIRLSDFKGQPIILDFGATWCAPCLHGFPVLEEIYHQFGEQGLQIVAVFSDGRLDEVKSYLAANPLSFTALWLDPMSEASMKVEGNYQIRGIPRTIFISADWEIKADITGLHSKEDLLEMVRKLGLAVGDEGG